MDYLDRAFEEKAHAQAPQLSGRVQAPSGTGVSGRRDPAWARQTPRDQPQPGAHLGSQIRGWLLRQRRGCCRDGADQEARIAALERLVGKLVLENEFLK